jgi:hypothetical protein
MRRAEGVLKLRLFVRFLFTSRPSFEKMLYGIDI